jgi:prepilin-type N-terminal cleavage/methylation domain-containing protein
MKKAGFVLIELIFAVAILLILTGSFCLVAHFLYRDYQTQVAQAEVQQEGRVALSLFSSDIQRTGFDPSEKGFLPGSRRKTGLVPIEIQPGRCTRGAGPARPILDASETVFHFMADRNGNSSFYRKVKNREDSDPEEEVQYEWVGGSGRDRCGRKKTPYVLYRDTGGGGQEVALGIADFSLAYYDADGNRLPIGWLGESDREAIHKVVLTVRAEQKGAVSGNAISAEIVLKNRE